MSFLTFHPVIVHSSTYPSTVLIYVHLYLVSHASTVNRDITGQKDKATLKVLHQQCPVSCALCSLISAEMEDTCQVCVFVLMCEFVCMFLWSGSINSPCGFGSECSRMTVCAMPEAEVYSLHSRFWVFGTELFSLQKDIHST